MWGPPARTAVKRGWCDVDGTPSPPAPPAQVLALADFNGDVLCQARKLNDIFKCVPQSGHQVPHGPCGSPPSRPLLPWPPQCVTCPCPSAPRPFPFCRFYNAESDGWVNFDQFIAGMTRLNVVGMQEPVRGLFDRCVA